MQIGDLSARTGATVRMLRYYEEQGLLRPERTGAGYRVFSDDDVLRVRYIRCMLASALPSSVVRQALGFLLDGRPEIPTNIEECRPLAEVLQGELTALDERITILRQSRDQLSVFVEDIRGQLAGDVYIREVLPGDLPDLYEHQADTEAAALADVPSRDRATFMAHWTKLLADDTVDKRTIFAEGRVAGQLVSFDRDGRREVGYWLGRRHWGKGFATKALLMFLAEIKTRPLYGYVNAPHLASQRVLEKAGFTRLGPEKDGILFRLDEDAESPA